LSTENGVQEQKPTKVDVDFTDYFNKISEEGVQNYKADLELIVRSEEITHEGITYKYRKLKRDDMILYKKLTKESTNINQDEDFEKYTDNLCQRACILIQDMTPQKFNDGDFTTQEKIVTGWSIRTSQGFHKPIKSP
jgi:hypothetical protein